MKISYLCVAGAIGAGLGTAHADVSWEHSASVRAGNAKQPVLRFKLYNNWSGHRHRLLLKYVASAGLPQIPLPGGPFPMTTFAAGESLPQPTSGAAPGSGSPGGTHTGGVAFIQRLDDDRILAYATATRTYMSEPLRPLLAKLRFDPWGKLAPELSKQPPPPLTPEQRKRLGAEVRAVYKPVMRNFWRGYFRPLQEKRTFKGIPGRGYRMTFLMNVGGMRKKDEEWARINYEWWLADTQTGDEPIWQFLQAARDIRNDPAYKSTSMWLNETPAVWWQMLPEELHQAVETFLPQASTAHAEFGGTPLYMAATITPPPLQRAAMGEVRMELQLLSRNTGKLAATVFDAPASYEHMPLEPFFKKFDEMKKQGLPPLPTTFAPWGE